MATIICIKCDHKRKLKAKEMCTKCYDNTLYAKNAKYREKKLEYAKKYREKKGVKDRQREQKLKYALSEKGKRRNKISNRNYEIKIKALEGDRGLKKRKKSKIKCQGCNTVEWCPIPYEEIDTRMAELKVFRKYISQKHNQQGIKCEYKEKVFINS